VPDVPGVQGTISARNRCAPPPAGHEVAIAGTHSYRARRWVKESKLGLSRVLWARWRADFEAI
jgi:hypothetical protein